VDWIPACAGMTLVQGPIRNVTTRHFFEKKNSKNFGAVARLSSREARWLYFNIYLHTFLCFWLARNKHDEMKCTMVTRVVLVEERHPDAGRDPEKIKNKLHI